MKHIVSVKQGSWLLTLSLLGQIVFWSANTHAQYREESSAIEQVYESRARTAIETILLPKDYSVVVGVDIDTDEQRLAELEQEVEKNNLPGMPGAMSLDTMPITNKLLNLKQKVHIHVILNETIGKDKEETVKSLLKMKLHLDEATGDRIEVTRSSLPMDNYEAPVRKIPELSWKMWMLVLIVSLVALASVIFFFNRRREILRKQEFEKAPEQKPETDKPETENKELVAEGASSPLDLASTKNDEDVEAFEMKQKILTIAHQFPEASTRALSDYFSAGHEEQVLLFMEEFGWELSKKLFASLSPRIWGRLGFIYKNRTVQASPTQYRTALEDVYRHLMARFLELGTEDAKNPFAFIFKLGEQEKQRLLKGESPAHLALICLHAEADQLGEIYDMLDRSTQEAVTLHLAKVESLPAEIIDAAVDSLRNKLKAIQDSPEVKADGALFVSQLLRKLDAEKEFMIFDKMVVDHPVEADKIRSMQLMYMDVDKVPQDIVAEAATFLELNVLVEGLFFGYPEVRAYILKALPVKKARMIEKDIELPGFDVPMAQGAQAKRQIVFAIEKVMKARNMTMQSLFNQKTEAQRFVS